MKYDYFKRYHFKLDLIFKTFTDKMRFHEFIAIKIEKLYISCVFIIILRIIMRNVNANNIEYNL